MPFPTIPTGTRIVTGLDTVGGATKTFPSLTGLTKNAGDLLIAICITYDGNSTNAEFSSWGGGFTEFHDSAGTTTMGIGCAYKWSTGAETGTFTVTAVDASTSDAAFFLLSIPGAHNTTIPEAGSRANGTTAAADPASFDPAGWDVEDTLWIAVGGSGEDALTGSYTGIASAPANYTDYAETGMSADAIGAVEGAVAFRLSSTASQDVGAFSVDVSNARNSAIVIAVRSPVVTYIRQPGKSFPPGRKMPRTRPEAQDPAYPVVAVNPSPASLVRTRALGAPVVSPQLRPASLVRTRALGSPLVSPQLRPASLVRTRVLGTHELDVVIILTGLDHARTLGSPKVNPTLLPASLVRTRVLGTTTVSAGATILLPASLVRTRALGSPQVNPRLLLTGLARTRALGAPLVSPQLRPASLVRTRALGTPNVVVVITPAGLVRTRTLGSPRVNPQLRPASLVRTRALGTPTFAGFQPAGSSHTHSINPHQHRDGDTS